MKILNKAFLPLLGLGLLASCSDNNMDSPQEGIIDGADKVYMQLHISQSKATRTATGNEGKETADATESNVSKVIIILADPTSHAVISAAEVSTVDKDGTFSADAKYTATGEFSKKEIGENFGTSPVDVFVVCNQTSPVTVPAKGMNIQQALTLASNDITNTGGIANPNNFLMSGMVSKSAISLEKPSEPNSLQNPYLLGTVNVVRAVARFDVNTTKTAFYFDKSGGEQQSHQDGGIDLTIDGIALVNMSKDLNLFKEIAANNTPTTWIYSDYDNNKEDADHIWVNDPKVKDKEDLKYAYFWPITTEASLSIGTLEANKAATFNYDAINPDKTITGGLSVTPQTKPGLTEGAPSNGQNEWQDKEWRDYKAWRYCVPNTILTKSAQKNGNSTGVIFRAKIAIDDLKANDLIYAYNNIVFTASDADGLVAKLKANEDPMVSSAYATALSLANANKTDEEATNAEIVGQLTAAKFTKYTTNTDGYFYCYYYYWNRHNDNGKPNEMGDMEFGVVRNNVYKLAVTSIKKLGHPGNPEPGDDPDPEDPGDDDEDEVAYLSVEVVVLPWDVRVNDIEF